MEKYSVLIGKEAKLDFLRIPFPFRRQVNQRVNKMKSDPRLAGAEAIAGSNRFRLDVAEWQILYEVDDAARTISIVAFQKVDPPSPGGG